MNEQVTVELFGHTIYLTVITTAILVFFVISYSILERFFPYKKGIKFLREGFWVDLVWYTFIQSYFLKILIFSYIIFPLEHAIGIADQGIISHWPIWALVLFFLVTHDFYIYWFHRWQHHNKWLWRTHEAHHSVKEVDWLAGSRSNVMEIIINQTIEFAPIIILLDVETAGYVVTIKALLDAVYGQFIHSNLDVKIPRPFNYIFNGPEMHQWHHADNQEVFYMNYGTKFSIWDYMFGTVYLPDRKPTKFGLYYEYPRDYFLQHAYSLIRFDYTKIYKQPWLANLLNSRLILWNKFVSLFPGSDYKVREGDPHVGPVEKR